MAEIEHLKLEQLAAKLSPPLWELLQTAARAAAKYGWELYLVGGVVRDLLLAEAVTGNLLIQDLDLVVDAAQSAVTAGVGVELAKVIQTIYPACRLEIYGTFKTAALQWDNDPQFGSLGVDIATARTESYSYPAANPIVKASSIDLDLYRRDFTINAMALRLTLADAPPLLDLYGGVADLHAGQLRVLHPDSFIDDPTRIYRGVRFAMRLGFHLEPQTETYIRAAINSGIYDRTAQANPKTPALQTRLKTELKHLLQVPYWQPALELLNDLGALQCIHSTLRLDPELLHQLRLLERCLQKFDSAQSLAQPHGTGIVHWQLRLEAIIAHLATEYREKVAKNLQLSVDSIDRLAQLDRVEAAVLSSLPKFDAVSQVAQLLRQYDLPLLILVAARCDSIAIRRQIWQYLTVWADVKPVLNGDDLKRLGYKPGVQYRQLLDRLLDATLDGVVTDKASAEAFLLK
jgi:tRNA nucleotidyltransferase (CCA-adding enzyme)